MHILLTVLCTFPEMLTRRICLTIKSFFTWWSFPLFSWPYCLIQGWYCEENLDASHSHRYLLDKFLLIQVFINDVDFNYHNYLTFCDTNMILFDFFSTGYISWSWKFWTCHLCFELWGQMFWKPFGWFLQLNLTIVNWWCFYPFRMGP